MADYNQAPPIKSQSPMKLLLLRQYSNTNTNDLINPTFASKIPNKPKLHQRSHSHTNSSKEWQQLIPPLPADQINEFNLSLDSPRSNKSNRHSMPGSPRDYSPQYSPQNPFGPGPAPGPGPNGSRPGPGSGPGLNGALNSPFIPQNHQNPPQKHQNPSQSHQNRSQSSGQVPQTSGQVQNGPSGQPSGQGQSGGQTFVFNSYSVKKPNEMPSYLKNQLHSNPPKFKRTNSKDPNSTTASPNTTATTSANTSANSQRLEAPFQMKGDPVSTHGSVDNVLAIPGTGPGASGLSNGASGANGAVAAAATAAGAASSSTGGANAGTTTKRRRKVCKTCGLDITGQFVRALNASFHVDCFRCNECGKQCSSKFFPFEIIDKETNLKYQVALCEYDYFKKLNLICFNCNNALRGPYITALGNKYHLEHFKCTICQKVFDSDESYYEHSSSIYCHYHYSKLFANHCEGCDSSIVKQFVELYRGGRNQQWHPECYMVHKFWNVVIKQDSIGMALALALSKETLTKEGATEFNPEEEKHLRKIEDAIESLVIKCWVTLSGYEELTASSISDMLLNACIGNQFNGLISTGKLIIFIEILFNAIDYLIDLNKFDLKKEARNLSGKIMSYLAILRKSSQINSSGSLSSELLSVITGCAHYLKLLIRIGLQNALKINKLREDSVATDNFLSLIRNFDGFQPPQPSGQGQSLANTSFTDENYIKVIQNKLFIPINSTDLCFACHKSIEKSCIKFNDKRWHIKCFKCSTCSNDLNNLNQISFDTNTNELLCMDCAGGLTDATKGFEFISDLGQLIYLLKIAFLRSKQVMALDYRRVGTSPDTVRTSPSTNTNRNIKSNYTDTLNDVTRLRTKRQSQQLSNSIKKNARKSVIIDAPEAENVEADTTRNDSVTEDLMERNPSVTSSNKSYVLSQDDNDLFVHKQNQETKDRDNKGNKIVIKDEPDSGNNHLNRTSDLLKNEKSLTLDDIPRIVAAEQARDQRPNAFKHHNSLYQRQKPMEKFVANNGTSGESGTKRNVSNSTTGSPTPGSPSPNMKYYSELDKSEHFILRHIAIEAFLQLLHSKTNKVELLSLIQTRKSPSFWDKLKFGGGSSGSHHNPDGVFGVDLQHLTKKYGIDSDLGVGPSKLRIPIVIEDIINSLKTKDMSVEGIFRLNGNIKRLRELTDQINGNPLKSPDFTTQTAVQLAALMKKWLRDLPNPLLTFNLYELWIASQKQPDPVVKKRLLKLIYCMLPRSHRDLVEVLLYFFNWVASFAEIDEETGSKMDIHNLATVISPNILYAKQNSDQINQSGETYFLAIEVVNQLIEVHEELSYIPEELMEFMEKCNFTKTENISTKEIMNKIDKVSKENPNYFQKVEVKDENLGPLNQEVRSNTITRGLSKVEPQQQATSDQHERSEG